MRAFILAVTGLALGVAACSSYGTSVVDVTKTPDAKVASVSIVIPRSIQAGQTAHAVATLKDANGVLLKNRAIAWFSSSSGVANVDDSGVVAAVAPGNTVVSAVSEGVSGQAAIDVIPPPPTAIPVASVVVSINPPQVLVGQQPHATATLKDAQGNALSGRSVVWQSSNAQVASVASTGDISAVGAGTATITASSEGISGSAPLTVDVPPPIPVASIAVSPATGSLQIGGTLQLSAVTRDANNNVLTGRVISWSSGNASIASVSALGLVTALAAGSVQINVSSEGQVSAATITVAAPPPVPVASVSIAPSSPSLQIGSTVQLSATTRDANNVVLTGRVVSWSSATPAVATVSSTGLVTAVAAGTASVTATSEGKVGSTNVTVAAPPPTPVVTTVTVSPASASVDEGSTVTLTATVKDQLGNTMTGQSVQWSSNNTSAATVNQSGVVTGVLAGAATVTATVAGKIGTSSITVAAVTPPPPPPSGSFEPSGMTVITERPFSALNEDGWTDNGGIVQDATAPRSPSGVGTIVFPAGFTGGDAPAQTYPNKTFNVRTLYVSVWMKISANWQGHPTGANKVLHMYISGLNHAVLNLWGSGSGTMQIGILLQGIVNNGTGGTNANWYANLGPTGEIVRGRWYHIEVVAVGNTSGAANGSIDWWVDGVKNGSHTGIQYVGGDGIWEGINWSPTWGGSGSVVNSTMTMYFDHFRMSGK
ncbi:MAG TPA: Ig-like domain-containing protein [Gemmatimonadaceae bacterium]|jgi:uncharacterized protein YjdB